MTHNNMAVPARTLVHAYEQLTPDVVLDALASIGLLGDGRLMALSSYENRVYQVHLERGVGSDPVNADSVVVKFYRPDRWSDAAIREEHAFSHELAECVAGLTGRVVEALAQHRIVENQKLPCRAFHRHASLGQALRCGRERHGSLRALAALGDQRLDREQPAQRRGAEQSSDQQEGNQQQLVK